MTAAKSKTAAGKKTEPAKAKAAPAPIAPVAPGDVQIDVNDVVASYQKLVSDANHGRIMAEAVGAAQAREIADLKRELAQVNEELDEFRPEVDEGDDAEGGADE
jgi:hypothetical protein